MNRTVVMSQIRSATTHLLGYGVVFAALWIATRATPSGRAHDLAAYRGRHDAGASLHQVDAAVLASVEIVTAAAAALVVLLVLTRRWRSAVPFAAVGAALVSTEAMKAVLPHATATGWVLGSGSFPSGHTTLAAAVSLAALHAAPVSWRQHLIGPLTAWTVLVATATITLGWHRPSDVVAALVVALAWTQVVSGITLGRISRPLTSRAAKVLAGRSRLPLWWGSASLLVLATATGAPSWQDSVIEVSTRSYLAALVVVACACAWVITRGRDVPVPVRRHPSAPAPR